MFSVRYIHAADLHLDAAFQGICREVDNDALRAQLRKATFTALDRLVALCLRERPDFVVIAGDIYNEEDQSLKAQLHMHDACTRLAKHNIPVFLAHGNHDPLSSCLKTLTWPENTHIFGEIADAHTVARQGTPVAIVHGISHASAREGRNLAKEFSRQHDGKQLFQLGVLHCSVDSVPGSDRYAPCSVDDLKAAELDAWALGHVHTTRQLSDAPFIAYSGNTQGLHIHEEGPKGCLLVQATPKGDTFEIASTFHSLSPIEWHTLCVDLEDISSIDAVESAAMTAIQECVDAASAHCEALMVRVRFVGRTELHQHLRAPQAIADLLERMRERVWQKPHVWIKDIQLDTIPTIHMDELLQRDDLLGETLRLAAQHHDDPEALHSFLYACLEPLLKHDTAKQIVPIPQGEDAHKLLEEAMRLCADMMEKG